MVTYKQDMPPQGGYSPIDWKQRLPRSWTSGKIIVVGVTIWGLACWKKYYMEESRLKIRREMIDSRIAVSPFMLAEKQREEIARWRENRDEENELMKNVDGWVTGTLFGEKVYMDDSRFYAPSGHEFYAHNRDGIHTEYFMKRLQRY